MTDAAVVSDLISGAAPSPAASPPAPVYRPEGLPATQPAFNAPDAVAARAEIDAKKVDKDFYAALKAEGERGISGPATQAWRNLHSVGYPADASDVNAQANARDEQQWNTYFAGLDWSPTPEQQAEMRAGVVRDDIHKIALQRRDAMVKDKAFYRRFLDGDRAAKEEWSKVVVVIGLRPVPASYFTDKRS